MKGDIMSLYRKEPCEIPIGVANITTADHESIYVIFMLETKAEWHGDEPIYKPVIRGYGIATCDKRQNCIRYTDPYELSAFASWRTLHNMAVRYAFSKTAGIVGVISVKTKRLTLQDRIKSIYEMKGVEYNEKEIL